MYSHDHKYNSVGANAEILAAYKNLPLINEKSTSTPNNMQKFSMNS